MIVLNSQLQSHLQDANQTQEDNNDAQNHKHERNPFQHTFQNEHEVDEPSSVFACQHLINHDKDDYSCLISSRDTAHQERAVIYAFVTGVMGFVAGKSESFNDPLYNICNFFQGIDISWLLGCAICSFSGIILLILLYCFRPCDLREWMQKALSPARTCVTKEDDKDDGHALVCDKDILEWRHRIIVALGSIHAPPSPIYLPSNAHTFHRMADHLRGRFITLVENHVGVCITIDEALQITRMVSSIQLGLGPVSPSLERIENKKIRRAQGGLAALGSLRSTHGMRQMLMQSLKEQHRGLEMIMEELTHGKNDYYEEASDVYNETSGDFYTIAMLKSCARRNKEMLSKVLSIAMVGHKVNSDRSQCLVKCLDSSCSLAEELAIYIRSYFDLNSNLNHSTDNIKGANQEVRKYIAELQEHFDAVQVTLWALTKGLAMSDADAELKSENMSLWDNLSSSLLNALAVHQCLEASLYPDDSIEDEIDVDAGMKANDVNAKVDVCEYDDEGKPLPKVKIMQDPWRRNKTLIFSGQGSKLPRKIKELVTSKQPSRAIPASFHESTGRLILLKELQSRLSTIDLPEELEASALAYDNHNEDDAPKQIRDVSKSEKTTNFFLGVTGDALSELKGAMIGCESEAEAHIIGDE